MRVANFISLFFGVIETSCLVWACFGFTHLQFIFENKKLFSAEKCTEEEIARTIIHTEDFQFNFILVGIYCEDAKNMFGLMWTLNSLSSTLGDFFLIVFQRYFGFVLTRLLYGVAQTAGYALIGMYEKSAYNVLVGQTLLCFAANRSFSQNIQAGDLYMEKGTIRLSIFGTGVALFGNIMFLLARKLEELNAMAIPDFFLILSCATAIIHIRTIFLLPEEGFPTSVTHEDNVFNTSWFGKILAKKKVTPEIKEENNVSEEISAFRLSRMRRMSRALPAFNTGNTVKDSLKEFLMIMIGKRFMLFTGIFLILFYRLQTMWGHVNAWLDYTYSEIEATCQNETNILSSDCYSNIEGHKNTIIDYAGLLNATHPIICVLMYLLHVYLEKRESKKENPVENRPMVNCVISYTICALALFALATFIFLKKSGDDTVLGFALTFVSHINLQLIFGIPNVVSTNKLAPPNLFFYFINFF